MIQVQELHRLLDFNKDGYVDLQDWVRVLQEQINAYLQQIKQFIHKRRIRVDDLLRAMGLTRSVGNVSLVQLKDAFLRLDTSLNDQKAQSAAKAVMRECDLIAIEDLLDELGAAPEEFETSEGAKDPNWLQNLLRRLKKKLAERENPNCLRDCFEQCDIESAVTASFPPEPRVIPAVRESERVRSAANVVR